MGDRRGVLIVEDEAPIRKFLRAALSGDEYHVIEAENGETGIRLVAVENPAVVLLDLGLPDIDGIEAIHRLREWSTVPIIVLTARERESDKITALDAGADDYVTKPFAVGELLARIRAVLRAREGRHQTEAVFLSGNVKVDFASRVVSVSGAEVHLTPIEFKLLATLIKNAGRVLTHRQLLTEVWGKAYSGETHYLRVFMKQLRHKIENDPAKPELLITEPGVGYRFRNEY